MRRFVIAAMVVSSFGALASSVLATPKDNKKPPKGGSGSGSGSGSGTATEPPAGDAGGGGGSATPAPPPSEPDKQGSAAPVEPGPDVDSLRQEYLSLRDEMFKSRARASAVASQLYSSRITVHFTWTATRAY